MERGLGVEKNKTVELADRYRLLEGKALMSGVQALVRVTLDQRRRDARQGLDTALFVSGYEGSPLAGFDLELQRNHELLSEHGILHRPAVNEELGATAVLGSQLAHLQPDALHGGVAGLWYGKAPGLDRASDALRHANLIGVERKGGVLACVGDDATAKSSTVPSGSELALMDLMMPTLIPADVQEVLEFGLLGFELSRTSGCWAAMKLATNIADGTSTVTLDRVPAPLAGVDTTIDGVAFSHSVSARLIGENLLDLERSLVGPRLEIARRFGVANGLNRVVASGPADKIGLVASGKAYRDLRQALDGLGIGEQQMRRYGIRLLKIGMPYPFDAEIVRTFGAGLDEVIVIEEKRALIETLVRDALYGTPDPPRVVGKEDEQGAALLPAAGELDVDLISKGIATQLLKRHEIDSVRSRLEILSQQLRLDVIPGAPVRTPYFCSGCPHNSSTKVPEGSIVGGGIGCHGLTLVMNEDQVGDVIGVTQMGGEGSQWIGMEPFVAGEHFIQNVGDGTFHHSGSLSLRAAVAADSNITFKILANSHVAMTGGQDIVGGRPIPDLTELLHGEGVKRVIVTTEDPGRYSGVTLAGGAEVWHRDRLIEAQETLARVPGVTAIVHDQECATELRRKRKRGKAIDPPSRVFINERVCEGCGDCGVKSNCLSVQPQDTEFGRKTQIHQASCNKDFSCLKGDCPSFLLVTPAKAAGPRREPQPESAVAPGGELPNPIPTVPSDIFSVRITGVGGTGIVTVAQVLAMAAHLEGRHVAGLDQLGLAQKGGAVVSDIRIGDEPLQGSNKLGHHECDLYLACDLVTGAERKYLDVIDAARTVAVLSTASAPTADQVVNFRAAPTPGRLLERRVLGRARKDSVSLDARGLALDLFGSDQSANLVLVGAAVQAGALPIGLDALRRAIELNGVAVDQNLEAIRWGRVAVVDPDAVERARREAAAPSPAPASIPPAARSLIESVGGPAGGELERLLAIRVPDLIAYQNVDYARRYVDLVRRAAEAERAGLAAEPGAFAQAVARNAYKLMAYKDEYEVARLHLDPELRAQVEAEFGPGARMTWMLHPPLLRSLGMKKKISLGPWFAPAFRLLRGMRRLRGTALDPFGRAEVRQVERRLVEEYEGQIESLLGSLGPDNHAVAVEIAESPDMIRGYEHLKLQNVADYRTRVGELRQEFDRPQIGEGLPEAV
ncbi:MAG: indolepyruvate ferredoxin oxidoreductase family protein [Actinobacteria bacterium]|nr:indolepyruvate ferredoxin oxidoreductase family protein [Actinomycetota bacterium]